MPSPITLMSAQKNDLMLYERKTYSLAGIASDDPSFQLFEPEHYGIQANSGSTSCWRGFRATYGLRENRLVLEELGINCGNPEFEAEFDAEIERMRQSDLRGAAKSRQRKQHYVKLQIMKNSACGPAIHGVYPVPPVSRHDSGAFSNHYFDVGLPMPFSGGLLICDSFIFELYTHMGFHPAWKYEEVKELTFSDGVLTMIRDRSDEMKKMRESLVDTDEDKMDRKSLEDIASWIERSFDRSYRSE